MILTKENAFSELPKILEKLNFWEVFSVNFEKYDEKNILSDKDKMRVELDKMDWAWWCDFEVNEDAEVVLKYLQSLK